MRVCFVCCEYPPAKHGGIGSVTQVLGRALVSAGHEVRVVGVYSSLEGLPATDEDGGVQIWRLPVPGGRFGWTRARRLLFDTVAKWANRGEIDVVEVPDWEGYAAGWPALRAPVVVRLHGSSSYFAREMNARLDWPAWCLEAASFHRADHCCSTSAYTAARTQKIFGPRRRPVDVLFNPVEFEPAPAQPRNPNRVVFAGTLTPKKGVRPLIEAWPAVVRDRPPPSCTCSAKTRECRRSSRRCFPTMCATASAFTATWTVSGSKPNFRPAGRPSSRRTPKPSAWPRSRPCRRAAP